MKCISELLRDPSTTISLTERFRRVGELLRVLVYVSQPIRDDPALLPSLEPLIQEEFLDSLHTKLAAIDSLLDSNEPSGDESTLPQGLLLVLRLLQFELGFRSAWTPKIKEYCENISRLLFKLALVWL